MSDVQKAVAELEAAFAEIRFPDGFLDDYDQLECLASGHGTETYLVTRKGSRQLFIAKWYDRNIHRCVHEGGILKALRHDGLPAFADEYEGDGAVCIVREYIPGTPLDRYVRERKPSAAQTVALCIRLCELLTCLHGQQPPVIHRDIKPQNVIVREDGSVALIDFEISRVYDDGVDADTQISGTRCFAPPEQYGFSQTDARADIYSLGVLLCWMLTGSAEVRAAVIPDRRLAAIVRRCTAFSPEARFRSADAVKRALLGAVKPRGRTALRSGLAAALLCLCLGFGVGRYTGLFTFSFAQGIRFQEPLIEQAVRLQLGVDAQAPLTPDELATVRSIYIFGNEVALTRDAFEGGLSGARGKAPRGAVETLEDVRLLPALEEIMVAYQNLSDIGPIAKAKYLASITLMHTRVSDVAPLAHMKSLVSVNLYDTNVTDVAILDTCPRLGHLDLGATLVRSVAGIGGRGSLEHLGLDRLTLDSLDGLEQFPHLTSLALRQAVIGDLSALRALPSLRSVEMTGDMRAQAEEFMDGVGFSVTFM